MKKGFKVLLIVMTACAAVMAVFFGFVYYFVSFNRATTPDEIARKVGLRLPAYEITSSEDNMDRTASAWSYYCFEIEFNEPLSESFLKKVAKKKTYFRDGDLLMISDESSDNWSCWIRFFPTENRAVLEYTFWDFLF